MQAFDSSCRYAAASEDNRNFFQWRYTFRFHWLAKSSILSIYLGNIVYAVRTSPIVRETRCPEHKPHYFDVDLQQDLVNSCLESTS